ncbi:MAG: hypothetical protein LBL38_02435 [Lactobacillales bacterium]|nr:hypothetical protein [Lactobacillales bacterium]
MELKRRDYEVYIGKTKNYEVDFVALKANGDIEYYQISEKMISQETLKKEIRSLQMIKDNYPKYLLTLDEYMSTANYEGIRKLNALDWLLDES